MKLYEVVVQDSHNRVIRTFKGYGNSERQVKNTLLPTLEALYGKTGTYTFTIKIADKKKNPCGSRRHNPRMSMKAFLDENRDMIDAYIHRVAPQVRINDTERRLWILNDEGLYNYARSEGVNV